MRIDSSAIGMESVRSCTSFSGRVTRFTVTNGRQSLAEGTDTLPDNSSNDDVEGEEAQAKENPKDSLKATFEEMRAKTKAITSGSIRSTEAEEAYEKLKEIRQQCINFLIQILFPERRSTYLREEGAGQSLSGAAPASGMLAVDLGAAAKTFNYSTRYYHEETETTRFSTAGTVRCADGRELNFNLNLEMSRSFQEYYEENVSYTQVHASAMCDPLVINLDGNIADLSDQTFLFDLDGDGQKDQINRLGSGSGFLALDKNGDGVINDGSELFGTKSGNGFADLAAYDTDQNGFIDEGDEIWDKLKIWVTDENGNEQLYSLAEKGVGAICLQNAATNYTLTGQNNQTNGMIRRTGIFLFENGNAGTIQHVDLALHESKGQEKIRQSQSKYEKWLYDMAM